MRKNIKAIKQDAKQVVLPKKQLIKVKGGGSSSIEDVMWEG